jgi:hypothetical protein
VQAAKSPSRSGAAQCFIDFIKDGPGASASSGAERVGGTLCLSGTMLEIGLSRIDVLIKTSGSQKPALDDLKKPPRNIPTTCHTIALATVPSTFQQSWRRPTSALRLRFPVSASSGPPPRNSTLR